MNTLQTTIVEHPFFQTMRPAHLALLSENAHEAEFKADEVLFHEGEPANRFFLIQTGQVELEWRSCGGGRVREDVVGPGEVLGWSWLFPPFSWHFTAEALEPTRVIVLDGGHLLVTCEKNPEFGYVLMKRITQIVIHRLQNARSVSGNNAQIGSFERMNSQGEQENQRRIGLS